jgi:hypothetical protein
MDAAAFATDRKARLTDADEELRPHVDDALHALMDGEDEWSQTLLLVSSQLWLDIFEAEDGGRRGLALARFRKDLQAALEKTAVPDEEVTDAQLNRVTYWLSGYIVNAATHAAMFANGTRFQRWVTMRDDDVRAEHRVVDGQIRPINGTFDVGGVKLRYPGEPVGPPDVWISCRCVVQPAARRGEVIMSPSTYEFGPEDEVELDNPDILVSDNIVRMPVLAAASVTDPTDIAVEPVDEENLIADELGDDEEEITEVPVHGVLAPEGVETGDKRMFQIGAMSTRQLPIPLRYETVGTHGGMTSDVVTVGRVDEAWRDDDTDSWRWRGAIVLDRPHAQEVIAGIIDGTVRGVSIDGDAAVEDTGERDRLVNAMNGVPEDSEEFADLYAELQALPTVYSAMRVAGLTVVPIPAFEEAYVGLGHDFLEDLTADQQQALAACGCVQQVPGIAGYISTVDGFKQYDAEARRKMAEDGRAMADGSFPIADEEDLRNAIQSIGRAADPKSAKAHIKRRASDLGHTELIPEDWAASPAQAATSADLPPAEFSVVFEHDGPTRLTHEQVEAAFAPGTHDGPGWITHPVPTARIRHYWTHGKGAAKIRWGAPGDFNRCRKQLAKYVQNPDWLAGLCANMHFEVLGTWPGPGRRRNHSLEPAVAAAPAITASGAKRYPASWFQNPGLPHAAPMQIDGQRIFGYLAAWGVCHIGVEGMCRDVPHSRSNYAYFLKGVIDTDAGEQRVGTLTYGIGHASPYLRAAAATAHYDQTDAVRAFVNIGEDSNGIWFAGVLAPWVTDDEVTALRAIGALSGDWRNWSGLQEDYELVGAVAVNTPGYQLAASGAIGLGYLPVVQEAEAIVASATMNVKVDLDADAVGAIVRTAVAEARHQEKVEAALTPVRQKIRAQRLAAARARLEGN